MTNSTEQSLLGSEQGDVLSPDLLHRISEKAVRVTYGDGELIHAKGDAKPGLSVIRSGAVRFVTSDADGRLISSGTLGVGRYFGEATLFANLPRTYDAVAIGETEVDQLSKARFDELFLEHNELARMMLRESVVRLYTILDFLDDIRRLPLPVRTVKLIANRFVTSDDQTSVNINQHELAFMLGVSRVSIGKTLGELQKQGVLKTAYGRIEIPGREQLRAWLEEHSS